MHGNDFLMGKLGTSPRPGTFIVVQLPAVMKGLSPTSPAATRRRVAGGNGVGGADKRFSRSVTTKSQMTLGVIAMATAESARLMAA